ncbi:hypothetical protein DUI87_12135 [Hirundo rustica rustica]|uniref:G-protein coupled receptors family 1 profile domain-containing protein n=1 Tax=Hirundo rustica rustica TaxID=333673 RepID=A0A3M0KJN1_HIRRU|nr:hypothetical protein DUI87_12135 [Hirundo rustica rustica]
METVHTGLLGGLLLVLIISKYASGACSKCYSTIYDGEDQESLIRVHTNVNPTCFDVNQLSTCREEGKQYWVAKNAATFKQRLTGECPIREWFCMEKVNDVKGVKDLIKEKALNIKKMETDEPLSPHGQSEEMSNSSSISYFLLLALADTRQLQLLHFCLFLGISLAALLGNGLIISAVACGHHLHTPMFFFLLNLALTDLGSILTTVPKAMHNSLWDTRIISYTGCAAQVFLIFFFLVQSSPF